MALYCACVLVVSAPLSHIIRFLGRLFCTYFVQDSVLKLSNPAYIKEKRRTRKLLRKVVPDASNSLEHDDALLPTGQKFKALYKTYLGRRNTLLLAAKVAFYRTGFDSRDDALEAKYLRLRLKVDTAHNSNHMLRSKAHKITRSLIVSVRSKGKHVIRKIELLSSIRHREVYLLREFVLNSLHPFQISILRTTVLGCYDDIGVTNESAENFLIEHKNFICLFLSAILAICIYFFYSIGMVCMAYAPKIYYQILVWCYIVEFIILDPLKLFCQFALIEFFANDNLYRIKKTVELRASSILRRQTGYLWTSDNVIQNTNPAIRAARHCMSLSVSKLLAAVHDSDMTSPTHRFGKKVWKDYLYYAYNALYYCFGALSYPLSRLHRTVVELLIDTSAPVMLCFCLYRGYSSNLTEATIVILAIPFMLFIASAGLVPTSSRFVL